MFRPHLQGQPVPKEKDMEKKEEPEKKPPKARKPLPKSKKPIKKRSDKEAERYADYGKAKEEIVDERPAICTGCGCTRKELLTPSHIVPRGNKRYFADKRNLLIHCIICNGYMSGSSRQRKLLQDYWLWMPILKLFDWVRYRNYLAEDYPDHPDLLLPHPFDN